MEEFEGLLSTTREKPTLATWRLSHESFVDTLKGFAAVECDDDDRNDTKFLLQTQGLFDRLNPLLAEQERNDEYFSSSLSAMNSPRHNEFSVVFGGKYVTKPESIPEAIVARLVMESPRIYTVSRSKPSPDLPKTLTHIQSELLDSNDFGKGEFLKVLNMAREEWQTSYSITTMVIYFTLGFIKGDDPFERNLSCARNFRDALIESFACLQNNDSSSPSWRVVVTGTNATLPSTHEDATYDWKDDTKSTTTAGTKLNIPTYKITKWNFIYAMTKLGQFYIIASAVTQLTKGADIPLRKKLEPIIRKIETYNSLSKKGENENAFYYLANHSRPLHTRNPVGAMRRFRMMFGRANKIKNIVNENRANILIAELDDISNNFDRIVREESILRDHFSIAGGITICYTPLHAKPWTIEAVKETTANPRLYIVNQVLWRLKNAISLEQAVAAHFPPPPSCRQASFSC